MPDRSFTLSAPRDFPYYRKVWKKVVAILIAAAFLPLVLIGGGMYAYLARKMKHTTMEALRTEAVFHKKEIDTFLNERIMDLQQISKNNSLSKMTVPGKVDQTLTSLQNKQSCFQDLGVISSGGEHLAYTGPYDLVGKNYRETTWFNAVMEKGSYVSDVFTGFRNAPHFIIAVKQEEKKGVWILRATVMSGLFDGIVTGVAGNRKGDAFLVNSKGIFQTTPRKSGKLMNKSQVPSFNRFKGVQVQEQDSTVRLTTWLDTVPWLSVVTIDKKDIFEEARKVRHVCLFVVLLAGFIIVLAILLTTDSLVSMLEEKNKNNRHLDSRLRRAAFLASSMEVSKGVYSDLNDVLSNIHVTAALMKEQAGSADVTETHQQAGQIFSQAIKGRQLIDHFLRFVEQEDPMIIDVDVRLILDRIIGFLTTSLGEKNICITTDFYENSATVRSDGSALRQVFLNLLLNAAAVVGVNGSIWVSTSMTGNGIMISISDDGPGLGMTDIKQMFSPQHLTDRGDSGFGLSVSRRIMERIGGQISVRNREEHGAVFDVQVPREFAGALSDSNFLILDG